MLFSHTLSEVHSAWSVTAGLPLATLLDGLSFESSFYLPGVPLSRVCHQYLVSFAQLNKLWQKFLR